MEDFTVHENARFIVQAGSRLRADRCCALTSLYISAKGTPLLAYNTSAALILVAYIFPVPRLPDLCCVVGFELVSLPLRTTIRSLNIFMFYLTWN